MNSTQIEKLYGAEDIQALQQKINQSVWAAAGIGKARAVVTSLGAYTTAAGVITVTAAGALGAQDGVTLVASEIVIVPENVVLALADAGIYSVTNAGGAGVQAVLTRVPWWANGAVITDIPAIPYVPLGAVVEVGPEGTLFGNSSWKSFAAKGQIVGTNDPLLYPREVTQQVALINGSIVVNNVPIKSTTKTNYFFVRTAVSSSVANTVTYQPSSPLIAGFATGVSATLASVCSLTWIATTSAGIPNSNDSSIGLLTVVNW